MEKPDFFTQKDGKMVYLEPRPDISDQEESRLYGILLLQAWRENPELAMLLHYFRCMGTKLAVENNSIKLQPVIDPKAGWPTQGDYNKERVKLMPYLEVIKTILEKLGVYANGKTCCAS